jgi:hypothetical protein
MVSENMVQMNIFGTVWEEITGVWRKPCIEACYSGDHIKEDEMDEMWHAWVGRYLRTGCLL